MRTAIADHPELAVQKLEQKLEATFAAAETKVRPILDRFERDGRLLQDYVVPVGIEGKVSFESNGNVFALFGGEKFKLHNHATEQIAARLGAPSAYVRNLVNSNEQWQRDLARTILAEHTGHTKKERMLFRTIGDEVRGVLSDSYRRYSGLSIFEAALVEATRNGAKLVDAHYDDTRGWFEFLNPEILPIPTKLNGTIYQAFGARLSNSDFGDGALDVRFFSMQLVCLNGLVGQSVHREVHLGSRLPDDLRLSERTYALDTKTKTSAVRDIFHNLLSTDRIQEEARKIQRSAEKEIDAKTAIKSIQKNLKESESDEIVRVMVNNHPGDGVVGTSTLWKLSQAVTAVARGAEERRKRELQEIAGNLLN